MAGKRWTGSAFTDLITTRKRWTGGAWADLTIAKRWTGGAWVDLFAGGGGGAGLPTGSWTGGDSVYLLTTCIYTGGPGCSLIRQLAGSKTFTGTYDSFSIPPTAGIKIVSIVGTTVNFTASAIRGEANFYEIPLTLTNGLGSTIVPLFVEVDYFYEDDSWSPGGPGNEIP
jgi:hypothetical protein